MKHTRSATIVAALSAAVLVFAWPTAASADPGQVEHYNFTEQESYTANDPDFCDGLIPFAVEFEQTGVGSFRLIQRQGQMYGSDNGTFVGSFTNVDTGLAYHFLQRNNSKDQKLVPIASGGLMATFLDRFNSRWTDDLGRADFHDAGANNTTVELDANGDFVNFVGNRVRGRLDTDGRDFCDDLIEFTTP